MASILHSFGYTPSKAYPDVWMRPAIKSDGTEYYKYALVYVDDLLLISCVPMKTIKGIKCVFKQKGYKEEPPNMYLGTSLEKVKTRGGTNFLSMSAEKYVKAVVMNLESTLAKRDMQIPTRHSTMLTNYHPSEYFSNEINARGVQAYQELIGEL